MKIFLKTFIITSIIMVAATLGVCASDFKDVPSTHWAYQAVNQMSKDSIINGYDTGNFCPNNEITKEEFAKMFVSTFNINLQNPEVSYYCDMSKNMWAYQYASALIGYMSYYTDDGGDTYYFNPKLPTLRAEAAQAIVMAKGLENEVVDYSVLDQFEDKSDILVFSSGKYIAIAVKNGLMKGQGSTFQPYNPLTRAETSMLLYNAKYINKIAIVTNRTIPDKENKEYSKTLKVKSTTPENVAINVDVNPTITIYLSEAAHRIGNKPTFRIYDHDENVKDALQFVCNQTDFEKIELTVFIDPLYYGESYKIVIQNIADKDGLEMEPYTFGFTTRNKD